MSRATTLILLALWLAAIAVGTRVLLAHERTAGASAGAPQHWPQESRLPRTENLPTLVMFAHPKCPCTKASLEELALVMDRCQGRVQGIVTFLQPAGAAFDWSRTALWQSASAIPGVTVLADDEGREAACFGVQTSGQVLLYGANQHLEFSGGITPARGHTGDNAGRETILAALQSYEAPEKPEPKQTKTQVFGCCLRTPPSDLPTPTP